MPSILLILLLLACNQQEPLIFYDLDQPYDIILIVGQSNTHAGQGLDHHLDAPDPAIKQFGRFGPANYQVIQAIEPLDHHTRSDCKIGFALPFSKEYIAAYPDTSRSVLIVPCGYGGTSFISHHWNKGDPLYQDAVERVSHILSHSPESRLVAILWHQGESDVGNPDYQQALDQFILDLRADLEQPGTPFILGGMVPYWTAQAPERMAVQEILKQTPQRLDVTGYADPTLPFPIEKPENKVDEIHYNAAGQRELGRRYFDVFQQLR